MASSGEKEEGREGDADMVLSMVTSPPLKGSDAGAILIGEIQLELRVLQSLERVG